MGARTHILSVGDKILAGDFTSLIGYEYAWNNPVDELVRECPLGPDLPSGWKVAVPASRCATTNMDPNSNRCTSWKCCGDSGRGTDWCKDIQSGFCTSGCNIYRCPTKCPDGYYCTGGNRCQKKDDQSCIVPESQTWSVTLNAAISGHNNEQHIGSIADCQALCFDRSWCKSFDYYKNDHKCDLSDKNKAEVGLKTDYAGNPYDHYEKPDGFIVLAGWAPGTGCLSGHNDVNFPNYDVTQCKRACLEDVQCKSIDWHTTNGCHISYTTKSESGSSFNNDINCQHFEREDLAARAARDTLLERLERILRKVDEEERHSRSVGSCSDWCKRAGAGDVGNIIGTAPFCDANCDECSGKCTVGGVDEFTDYGSGCMSGNKICCCQYK